MKNLKLIIFILIMFLVFSIAVEIRIKAIDSQSQILSARILEIEGKVVTLYSEGVKTRQNVFKSLDEFQTRIWQVEDNVKLQNEFMKLEYDKYQAYYEKHWKEKRR